MRRIISYNLAGLIFLFLMFGCSPNERELVDWLHHLPQGYIPLEDSALDSLIQFGEYLDPNGDSLQQAKYELRTKGNTVEINQSFTTGQRGFRNEQFKLVDKNHLVICTSSGSPWNSSISQISILELEDNSVSIGSDEVLSKVMTSHDFLGLTQEEELNGVTGCDFFTDEPNTVRVYYLRGTEDKAFNNKEVTLEWTDPEFIVLQK